MTYRYLKFSLNRVFHPPRSGALNLAVGFNPRTTRQGERRQQRDCVWRWENVDL
jgi:hypothetical protein